MDRRTLLGAFAAAPLLAACRRTELVAPPVPLVRDVGALPLHGPWPTPDPFLFCVHHDDAYPAGNEVMGPASPLAARAIGQDFSGRDGWSMYHGQIVPGFPQHPHRGFETVTVVRRGLVDHADSLGAVARYGQGDVQWLTAGSGIVHAEMFPLLNRGETNPLELFQIWLNLPSAGKFAAPHFVMLWADGVPRRILRDAAGGTTELTVVAGQTADARPGEPPPHSWASRTSSNVAIWTLKMSAGASYALPASSPGANRRLYFFRGDALTIGGRAVPARHWVDLRPEAEALIQNGPQSAELLLLQGQPIGEPVVAHGPFVMNTRAEIQQAYADYNRTGFGGWPWPNNAPVHGRNPGRFARHPDGRVEKAG